MERKENIVKPLQLQIEPTYIEKTDQKILLSSKL